MPIKRTRYDVAYIDPRKSDTDIHEATVEVWGVDELRAEMEGRRMGVRGPKVDPHTREVTDLGDHQTAEGLQVWAALVRLGLYDDRALEFTAKHYVGSAKVKDPADPERPLEVAVDPTHAEANTASA